MSPPPRLSIHHPLPHLTEFIVSPANASTSSGRLFRLGLVLGGIASLASRIHLDLLKEVGFRSLRDQSWSFLLPLLGIALLLLHLLTFKALLSESITPLPSLGLLLKTRHARLLFSTTTTQRMIPLDEVIDVCINEGLRRWAVVGYLCVLRKGREESVVVFEETMPRTTMLIEVYHGIREILFDEFDEEEREELGEDEEGRLRNGAGVGGGIGSSIY
ncbi:hypothetical protein BDY24DRAFT_444837 [Mrakia frigida]|uniref:PIG-H family GPI synthesis protein n=1 Tax=Mrakia frigida TaxID=29902 RepID=UPI003FCC08DC